MIAQAFLSGSSTAGNCTSTSIPPSSAPFSLPVTPHAAYRLVGNGIMAYRLTADGSSTCTYQDTFLPPNVVEVLYTGPNTRLNLCGGQGGNFWITALGADTTEE